MRQLHQILTFAIAISTITVLAFAAIPFTTANAITVGTTVIFLIRSDDIQPTPPSGAQDRLVFTGKPATFIDTTGCTEGTHPVQQATLVDMDGQSGRVDVIVLSETDPIPAGTEVQNLTSEIISCTINGVTYDIFSGTVTRTP